MSDHNCPKRVRVYADYYLNGYMDQVHPSNLCWVCEQKARSRYAALMPILPELYAWLEDGQDFSSETEELLYEKFMEDMDYGTLTGDDNTFDQWIADRPERIEALIRDIEYYCIEAVA